MIIILDTNFLIYLVKHKMADQIKSLGGDLVVPETVENELKKPSFGPEDKNYASAALQLIKLWKASIVPASLKNVDKSIIELAKEFRDSGEEVYVATMDAELRDKLSAEKVRLLSIKRGKILTKE